MQSKSFFKKVVAVVLFLGICYPLYLILHIIFLGVTLYAAYFIYAFNGVADATSIQAGAPYALLIDADYILSILVALCLTWKIVKYALGAMFPVQAKM